MIERRKDKVREREERGREREEGEREGGRIREIKIIYMFCYTM